MPDLKTTYMGLQLDSPLVVASSRLSNSLENVKKLEAAGASAVVLKSLFEEQIERNADAALPEGEAGWHPEADDYVRGLQMELGARDYLDLVRACKEHVRIPVIASLNCVSAKGWTDYANKLEAAGADALELNVAHLPTDPKWTDERVREHIFDIVDNVKLELRIPVAVKIGPFFSSLSDIARHLQWRGAAGLVLFNRFYRFDIDVEHMRPVAGNPYSSSDELSLSLRWISILSDTLDCDLAASTGIHTGKDVLKALLAGAAVTQLCSTLFINGLDRIREIRNELEDWMKRKGYETIDQFRGKASREHSRHPELHERLQYIKAIVGIE